MSNSDPQLEFNFTNKRPFSEVPRRKSLINQKAIQVEGVFVLGDPHPEFDGLFFYKRTVRYGQNWATLEKITDIRAQSRKWDRENSEKKAAYMRKWQQANPEKNRANTRKWAKANPEKKAAKLRKWAKANPEKKAACHRRWLQKNPTYNSDYYQNNKELFSAHAAKRRKKLKTNIKLHKTAKKALQAVYKLRECLNLCARSAGSSEAFHVDHVWPIQHEKFCGLHAPWNLQILEASENISKSNKPPSPC